MGLAGREEHLAKRLKGLEKQVSSTSSGQVRRLPPQMSRIWRCSHLLSSKRGYIRSLKKPLQHKSRLGEVWERGPSAKGVSCFLHRSVQLVMQVEPRPSLSHLCHAAKVPQPVGLAHRGPSKCEFFSRFCLILLRDFQVVAPWHQLHLAGSPRAFERYRCKPILFVASCSTPFSSQLGTFRIRGQGVLQGSRDGSFIQLRADEDLSVRTPVEQDPCDPRRHLLPLGRCRGREDLHPPPSM